MQVWLTFTRPLSRLFIGSATVALAVFLTACSGMGHDHHQHGAGLRVEGAPAASGGPRYAVDASWPQPLPNQWILGQVAGIAGIQSHGFLKMRHGVAHAPAPGEKRAHFGSAVRRAREPSRRLSNRREPH